LPRACHNRRSFLVMEVIAAVGLTVVLLSVFTAAYWHLANARHEHDARRQLRLAADAELLRLRAVGLGVDSEAPSSRPAAPDQGEVALQTTVRPGEGIWIGLNHVTVVARRQGSGRGLRFELSAYILPAEVNP